MYMINIQDALALQKCLTSTLFTNAAKGVYLVVQRESKVQFTLPVEDICHVEITTRCPDVICAIYS